MRLFLEYLIEQEEEKYPASKIMFTGLDDAGKSSIILALQREFAKIANIEPTKATQRRIFTLLGKAVSEWDLGGQKHYCISYLKNPGKYFDGTAIAIYVIDIQNSFRLSESLSYLNDVIKRFRALKINPPINVLFHKYDPDLVKVNQNEVAIQINDIIKRIKKKNYKKIRFFRTSIYDLYSIMNAMSEILLEIYPKSDLIQKTIEEFANKLNCEGLMIIDNNSLIIGSYFINKSTKNLLTKIIGSFLRLNDSFLEIGLEQQNDQIFANKFKKYFLFKRIVLKESILPYYVLIIKADNPFDLYFLRKDLLTLTHVLKDIIYK